MEVSEQWLKAKHNAAREEAALDLSIKVVRRFERNGLWRDYGYEATPLTQEAEDNVGTFIRLCWLCGHELVQ